MADSNLFFWAIIPDSESRIKLQALKEDWATTYRSFRSLNSPPHITIIPPVRISENQYAAHQDNLRMHVSRMRPFELHFTSFGRFGQRVIYLQPEPSDELSNLYELSILTFYDKVRQPKHREFHPHLTLVFKDLKQTQFERAWKRWGAESINVKSHFHGLKSLIFKDQKWIVRDEILFEGSGD